MSESTGLASACAAVLLFGSFALPTKTCNTGDGITFQFYMCAGIFLVGTVTHLVQCSGSEGCPAFIPYSSVGGAIWCLSNLLLVPLVDSIGIGLVMMMWGMCEMLTGWLTARFALFGLNPEPVARPVLNYCGVILAVASLFILVWVQPELSDSDATLDGAAAAADSTAADASSESTILLLGRELDATIRTGLLKRPLPVRGAHALFLEARGAATGTGAEHEGSDTTHGKGGAMLETTITATASAQKRERKLTDRLSPTQRRIFGVLACCVCGALSGSTFTPAQAVVDATTNWAEGGSIGPAPYPGASTKLIDHLYAHFTGIFLASTVFLILYCAAMRNAPHADPASILPAVMSGVCWGMAMLAWFEANQNLSIVISFPIVTMGPGLVNLLYSVLLFKEIRGARNFTLLLGSIATYAAASVLIVSSQQ